ncbi:hypothetical protein [Amycolatopsis sp. NPDC051071]|uniref:hypothetical protein n=1 Tax=Amycolatopsis sp. NPDC051071 TaxID=3154637 RepID=UPI00342DAD74
MTELGAYVERYETNNRRRALTAAVAMVLGLPLAALGAFLFALGEMGRGGANQFFPGIIIGCGLGLALLGVSRAWQAVRRRGEVFTLYEAGLVHTWGKTTTVVPWNVIDTVTDHSKTNALAKVFGGDVSCLVKLGDGRKVLINGYTEGAAVLMHNVFQATGQR